MAQRILSGNLSLSSLKHVKMTCKGQTGDVEGMFIPFEANKLTSFTTKEGEKVITMPIRVIVKDEADSNGQHGFVAKSLSTEDYKLLKTDAEKEHAQKEWQPILGSIKDFSASSHAPASGAASDATFSPTDDVPF